MTRDEIEALWRDPRNRRWGLYYCKDDPRVIVPKSYKWMGWTVNAAHPAAIPVTILLLLVLAVPVLGVIAAGGGVIPILCAEAGGIAIVCAACAWLASRY